MACAIWMWQREQIVKESGESHTHNQRCLPSPVAVIGFGLATEYLGELAPKATAENAVRQCVEHRVQRIVDGDTVYMRDGTKVRLHGIDDQSATSPWHPSHTESQQANRRQGVCGRE